MLPVDQIPRVPKCDSWGWFYFVPPLPSTARYASGTMFPKGEKLLLHKTKFLLKN